jgi:hypothetical protein
LSFVFSRQGEDAAAQRHRDLGFTGNAVLHVPCRGTGEARRALVLVSTAGGDFNTAALLDAQTFDVTKVFVEYADALPAIAAPYTVVNAIGDADRCGSALAAAQRLVGRSGLTAVLNPPGRILQTGRIAGMERLRKIEGIAIPRIALVPRSRVREAGFSYPFLLRTPGHHTGRHFVRIEHASELDAQVAALPGDDLLAIEYHDVRSADGLFRKYRVLAIAGELFPLHLAASASWKVHFFTGGASGSETQRAQDAAFLSSPRDIVGETAWRALHAVVDAFGLDYMGVDFGIDAAGRLVVFEANATMSVYDVPQDPLWDYRRDATLRVVAAFHEVVQRRSTNTRLR